jgi:hypothetical protein
VAREWMCMLRISDHIIILIRGIGKRGFLRRLDEVNRGRGIGTGNGNDVRTPGGAGGTYMHAIK